MLNKFFFKLVLFFRKVCWYLFLELLDFSVPKFIREKLIRLFLLKLCYVCHLHTQTFSRYLLKLLMKLQKQISKKNGRQEFFKYVVVLPNKTVDKLGWQRGEELVFNITSRKLLLIGPKD